MNKWCALPVLWLVSLPLLAGDFRGADVITKDWPTPTADDVPTSSGYAPRPHSEWFHRVEALAKKVSTLPPGQAASEWLALFDQWCAQRESEETLTLAHLADPADFAKHLWESVCELFGALPPPDSWDAFAKAIATRTAKPETATREPMLRFLGAFLTGDHARLPALLATIEHTPGVPDLNGARKSAFEGLQLWLALIKDDPRAPVQDFERWLVSAEKGFPKTDWQWLGVPDLVTIAGEAKARSFLRRVLDLPPGAVLQGPEGEATDALLVNLAMARVPKAKRPCWELARGLSREETTLFEALEKRFPHLGSGATREDAEARREAEEAYIGGLIEAGRMDDARRRSSDLVQRARYRFLGDKIIPQLLQAGYAQPVAALLREQLSANPLVSYWEEYLAASLQAGDAPAAIAFLREVAARPGLHPFLRERIIETLWPVLVALDRVDEGVEILRDLLAARQAAAFPPPPGREPPVKPSRMGETEARESLRGLAMALGKLGQILGRPEWMDEALGVLALLPVRANAREVYEFSRGDEGAFPGLLLARSGGPEAEALLANDPGGLARLYDSAGRPEDVLKVLGKMRAWRGIRYGNLESWRFPEEASLAARALLATGKPEGAREALVQVLFHESGYNPGYDSAYELLLKTGGAAVPALLDRLAARAPLDPRPRLWKAKDQLEAGQLAEAEKTVRAAIALDPGDTAPHTGKMLQAYVILAEILEKKGEAEQARAVRSRVKAHEQAGEADGCWNAGLVTRAAQKYEEALALCEDAWSIHLRLGRCQTELGEPAKAAAHFRRGFELMPAALGAGSWPQFSKAELNCKLSGNPDTRRIFSQAEVYGEPGAWKIADEVFTRLAAATPPEPRSAWLLGVVRREEGRFPEAAALFRRAVDLDPEYLDAWKDLLSLSGHIPLPRALCEQAWLAFLRLAPLEPWGEFPYHALGHNLDGQYLQVTDLRALWKALEARGRLAAAEPVRNELDESPAAGFAGHAVIGAIMYLLERM